VPAIIDVGVCIRHWDWSETSQTVSVVTRQHGLIRAIAKGSKRRDARFSGGLEVATLGELGAILKPGPGVALLTAWDLRETFTPIRRSLSAFHAAMFLLDLVYHTVVERDPHPRMFDALVESLGALGAGPRADRAAVLRFQWINLDDAGYRPELGADVATGEPLAPARAYGFAPHLGGLTTDPGDDGSRPGGRLTWRVRAETVEVLRALAGGAPVDPAAPGHAPERASRLLFAYVREVIGRDLPAAGPLFGNRPGA
jgi:DNA repair protein RecO (recombination protein O)